MMRRNFWAGAGIFCGLWCLTVVWVTAEAPIYGNRAFNWLVIFALIGAGMYCFRRAGV